MIRPCGSCLTAEFADDDAEDDETLVVRPGSSTGHLRRPSGSAVSGVLGVVLQAGRGGKTYTYCGRPVGDDWQKVPR